MILRHLPGNPGQKHNRVFQDYTEAILQRMRVLILGSVKEYAIERFYIQYLKEWGAEVTCYASADKVDEHRSRNLLNRILFRIGINKGYTAVNNEMLTLARDLKPDIIWVFKGMEILPDTLKKIRRGNLKLVNYNPDHPFIFSGKGSGNTNVTQSVGLYDLHFCYHEGLRQQIAGRYQLPAVYLPFAFDLSIDGFEKATLHPERKKICFIGNPDRFRVDTILMLSRAGFEIDIYGHGWQRTKLALNINIGIYDAVYGQEFWNKLRQYRVQLNIFRKHNLGSHNMRSFEVPAVGGIQLTPFSEEQAGFFEENKEVFFYRHTGELEDKCRYLLDLPDREANAIREAARRRSATSGYTYRDRGLLVYNTFKNALGW